MILKKKVPVPVNSDGTSTAVLNLVVTQVLASVYRLFFPQVFFYVYSVAGKLLHATSSTF